MRKLLMLILLIPACDPLGAWPKDMSKWVEENEDTNTTTTTTEEEIDADNDGFIVDEDCDDSNPDINPDADEICDGVDNNCDGTIDDDAIDKSIWYLDEDIDNYGGTTQVLACEAPSGYVELSGDCDDSISAINPNADEICDYFDNDCDGDIDDDDDSVTDQTNWYHDNDSDGYGTPYEWRVSCIQTTGYVDNSTDCDDNDQYINPGVDEIWYDGIDQDCAGDNDYDADEDGFESAAYGGDDCNDSISTIYPGFLVVEQGIDFGYVCPGSFLMGSPEDELGRDIDEVQHKVTLSRVAYMSLTEITQDQYLTIMGLNPSEDPCSGCPVENVSWHDAALFANTLSENAFLNICYTCTDVAGSNFCAVKGDSIYDCNGYRLPTEAEWEYVARSHTETAFSLGGGLLSGSEELCGLGLALDNGAILSDIANFCGITNSIEVTGSLEPNLWGFYDMYGNVSEWVNDIYRDYEDNEVTDPEGPDLGTKKVFRGGSYVSKPEDLRSANRDESYGSKTPTSGFRIIRNP